MIQDQNRFAIVFSNHINKFPRPLLHFYFLESLIDSWHFPYGYCHILYSKIFDVTISKFPVDSSKILKCNILNYFFEKMSHGNWKYSGTNDSMIIILKTGNIIERWATENTNSNI